MKPGIDPKVDYAFKRLFGSEQTKDILIDLLNAVLRREPERAVVEVTLLNPINDKDSASDKQSILDIKARDQSGRLFNIEMQMFAPVWYVQRALFYWAELYSDQMREGHEFHELRPTISISFLDNRRFGDLRFHHVFRLRDEEGMVLTEDLEIHVIELPKFNTPAQELTDPLEVWCYFLRHAEELDSETLPTTLSVPIVRRALEVLDVLSQNEQDRMRYLGARIAQLDATSAQRASERAERDRQEKERAEQRAEKAELELAKAKLVSPISMCQGLLDLPLTPEVELYAKPIDELEALLRELKTRLRTRP